MSDAPVKAFRYDAGHLRPAVETSQGFLRLDGHVGRAGIYEYVNTREDEANGLGKAGAIRREYRPEEEVYRADALAQFEGAPLTAGHPSQQITPKNVRAYEIGTVTSQARRDGDRVAASMVVKDPSTIARVKSGELVELSPGYLAAIHRTPGADARHATPGNPEGRYDCVQRDIEINHLALVPRARGGADLRVRLDGADDVAIERRETDHAAEPQKRHDMADMSHDEQIAALKLQLDQANRQLAERKDALDAATTARDGANARLRTLEEQVAALNTKLAAGATAMETKAIAEHKERADAAETKLAELNARREADIRAAAEVRLKAQAIMGASFRCDGMDDRSVRAVVIKKLAPNDDTGEKVSDAFIASRFDSLAEAYMANARSLTRAGEVLARRDVREDEAGRPASRETRAKAWRDQALNQGYGPSAGRKEA